MKLAKVRSCLLVVAGSLVLIGGQFGGVASAAADAATNNANSLKISPLRTDITIEAGKDGVVKTYITNLTKNTIVLKPIENDFVSGDEKGTPSIILDENSYAPSHSLKRFMVPQDNITVEPGATRQVDVHIQVPEDAQAGGYFGAIRFAPASSSGQPVDLNASVASLILLRVPGPTVEDLKLTNFDIQQNGGTASNFRTPDNLELLVRFQNKGNVHLTPFGQINVKKDKKVVYKYDFNQEDPKGAVLPDSARRWQVPIKDLGKFGKYTITGTFGYGSSGETINIEKTVWIIPTTYILGAIGAVLFLIVLVGGIWFFLRSYKRRIIRSSSRRRY